MKRIAFARIAQETNALSPVATTLADFQATHYLEGDDVLRAATAGPEVKGFLKRMELAGFLDAARERKAEIEPVPILSAWAMSSGPLAAACLEELEARLIEGLRRAGPLDGMYFCMHGAMGALGIADPESRLLRSVRSVIGGAPLVISHDLHANLTRARVEAADAVVAYQTNPHRDHVRVGRKAGQIAIGTVLGEIKPTMAWRTLPMILGGGKTIDFLAPMRTVFRHMRRAERRGEVLSASTLMVHPWNDDPSLGWSTVAVTNNDVAGAERLADELAELCWARRHEQPPVFATASEGIARARAAKVRRKLGCVTMSDASDVVPAGAPGDSTHLLRALLAEATGLLTYAAVRDPQAIETLWSRRAGEHVELPIGGTLESGALDAAAGRRHGGQQARAPRVRSQRRARGRPPARGDHRGASGGGQAVVLLRGRAVDLEGRHRDGEELLPVPDVLPAVQPQDGVRAHERHHRLRRRVPAPVRRTDAPTRRRHRLARARPDPPWPERCAGGVGLGVAVTSGCAPLRPSRRGRRAARARRRR